MIKKKRIIVVLDHDDYLIFKEDHLSKSKVGNCISFSQSFGVSENFFFESNISGSISKVGNYLLLILSISIKYSLHVVVVRLKIHMIIL